MGVFGQTIDMSPDPVGGANPIGSLQPAGMPWASTSVSAPAATGISADDVLARLQVLAHRYEDAGRMAADIEHDIIDLMQSVMPRPTVEEAACALLDRLSEIQFSDPKVQRLRASLRRALLSAP